MSLTIQPYNASHASAVGPFILSVQHEHGVPITMAQQPDLANIEGFYQQRGGNFWVAMDDGKMVGTAALLHVTDDIVLMRKLFVAPTHRGAPHQLGKTFLGVMLDWARAHGFKQLYLGTVHVFQAACRFYEKHGFTRVAEDALPQAVRSIKMPVDDTFYMKELAQ